MTYWNSTDCADFFRCTRRHFMEQIKPHHTFPRPVYMPRVDGAVGRPLWRASEVQAWAENHGRAERREVRRAERSLKRVA
jgi:predicted DNA-binding transcriptional regulator AlpA